MLDLIGDLSLNATSGHAGLPIGHVVAYKVGQGLGFLRQPGDEAGFQN